MRVIKSCSRFWNYAKNKIVTVNFSNCPRCDGESEGVIPIGDVNCSAFIRCTQCGLCSREYDTDTNHYFDFGIEQAMKHWNSKDHYFLDPKHPYDFFEFDSVNNCLYIA